MSILSTIKETLFKKYNINDVTGITTAISSQMADHIELWNEIMTGSAAWNADNRPCGVTEAIAGALSDPISEEIEVTSENEMLQTVMKHLNEHSTELTQNLALCGSSVIRPVFTNGKMQYEIIRLGNYIPTSYDFDGTLTGALILKQLDDRNDHYLLIERHEYKAPRHSVKMELYKIENDSLVKTSLNRLPQTAELTESYSWPNVEKPMIIEVRNRKPNKIDGSLVPVSLYAGYENLIEDADAQYNRMNWEQESAKRIIFADEDLFSKRQEKDGTSTKIKLGKLRSLLVKVQGSRINSSQGIETFSPELRTAGQVEAFQQILRRLELCCNIGKGTLSDLEQVSQTATQYTGGKKALYTAIDTIESELEDKYHHAAYVFAYMLSAYMNIPFNDEITITFNDSTRKDEQSQKQTAMQEIQNKLLNPYEYRMRFYGEDEETAKANAPAEAVSNDYGGMFGVE